MFEGSYVVPFLIRNKLLNLSCSFKPGIRRAVMDTSNILHNFISVGAMRSIFSSKFMIRKVLEVWSQSYLDSCFYFTVSRLFFLFQNCKNHKGNISVFNSITKPIDETPIMILKCCASHQTSIV